MKKETGIKLRRLIERLIREESHSGKTVAIAGDRGRGTYKVKLVKPRPDLSDEKSTGVPEEIWQIEMNGKIAFAVKYDKNTPPKKPGLWGELDPFIEG